MTRDGPDPAAALFQAALDAPPERRGDLLEAARRTDPALCAEVESLLRYHDTSDAILGAPDGSAGCASPAGAPEEWSADDVAPRRVGPYEVVRRIGRGGMGEVYLAKQESPARDVALKVVRPELASPEMVVRLQREAEALGRLKHPGVAHVYHCGSGPDDTGRRRTYVVMELIDGSPLTAYLEEARPSTPQRLELLARVCDAVDHAHRRGVIHRDIKPSNILVTRDDPPAPKVLDFGLARVRDGAVGPEGAGTLHGQIMGTLAYMSPEQAGAGAPDRRGFDRVDTRSDVYALGAVLFEALTGRPPIQTADMTIPQALQAIATQPRALAGQIDRRLRGDIESVIGKALEMDPGRRYASAAELAADLRRIGAGQPVLARPQTALYQMRKLAGRNRAAALALGALALAVTVGAGVATWQAVRIGRERDRAESQARRARATAEFLRRMIFAATPERGGGRETTLRALLDEAADDFRRAPVRPGEDPLVAIETLTTLASGYMTLSEFGRAEALARRAVDLALAQRVEHSVEGLEARIGLAMALSAMRGHREALALAQTAAEHAERDLGAGHPIHIAALRAVAMAHARSNSGAQHGLPFARRAFELAERGFDRHDERTIDALDTLAWVARATGAEANAETEGLLRELVTRRRDTRGPEHYRTLEAVQLLGRYLQRAGSDAECRELLEPLLPVARRVLPAGHNLLIHIELNLGEALLGLGEPDAAIELLGPGVSAMGAARGDGDIETVIFRGRLIAALVAARRAAEAEAQIAIQEPIAIASGDVHFKLELDYQRLWVALVRGQLDEAHRLAGLLKGTVFEGPAGAAIAEYLRDSALPGVE